jgi:hypothetical protein
MVTFESNATAAVARLLVAAWLGRVNRFRTFKTAFTI